MDVSFLRCSAKFFPARRARDIAFPRRQRFENGIESLHRFVRSANHHAISAIDSPNTAAGSDIDVMNSLAFNFAGTAHVIFEIGIAAVNDDVAGLHVLRQLLHGLFGGIARGHHHPPRAAA